MVDVLNHVGECGALFADAARGLPRFAHRAPNALSIVGVLPDQLVATRLRLLTHDPVGGEDFGIEEVAG